MAVVLLVSDRDQATYITPRAVRWHDRIAAHVRAFALDEALARGDPPESSAALQLRAATLIATHTRQRLAARIVQILQRAHPGHGHRVHLVAIPWRLVHELEPDFTKLVLRLLDEEPVEARGVAQTRILLADGRGPLYHTYDNDPFQLRDAIHDAITTLQMNA